MTNKTLVALSAIAASVFLVAIFAWAQTVFDGSVTVTDDLIVADDITVSGDVAVTGSITGWSSEKVAVAAEMDSTCTVAGTFKALTATYLSKAVVCSSTVAVTGAITATGGVTGDVTGDLTTTGSIFQTVAEQGNLPAAGDNQYEFFHNTAGDTGWVSDVDSWVQLWP